VTPAVLIVDDIEFMREVLKDVIAGAGMRVAGQAANGQQALELYAKLVPEIVLLDIEMPVMNGLIALRRLRRMDRDSRIIMCSARGEQQMILRAIQLGARDFVVKPFKAERVVNSIRRVLQVDGLLPGLPDGRS
jgi:two-component system chemotaxis response regulator CheY